MKLTKKFTDEKIAQTNDDEIQKYVDNKVYIPEGLKRSNFTLDNQYEFCRGFKVLKTRIADFGYDEFQDFHEDQAYEFSKIEDDCIASDQARLYMEVIFHHLDTKGDDKTLHNFRNIVAGHTINACFEGALTNLTMITEQIKSISLMSNVKHSLFADTVKPVAHLLHDLGNQSHMATALLRELEKEKKLGIIVTEHDSKANGIFFEVEHLREGKDQFFQAIDKLLETPEGLERIITTYVNTAYPRLDLSEEAGRKVADATQKDLKIDYILYKASSEGYAWKENYESTLEVAATVKLINDGYIKNDWTISQNKQKLQLVECKSGFYLVQEQRDRIVKIKQLFDKAIVEDLLVNYQDKIASLLSNRDLSLLYKHIRDGISKLVKSQNSNQVFDEVFKSMSPAIKELFTSYYDTRYSTNFVVSVFTFKFHESKQWKLYCTKKNIKDSSEDKYFQQKNPLASITNKTQAEIFLNQSHDDIKAWIKYLTKCVKGEKPTTEWLYKHANRHILDLNEYKKIIKSEEILKSKEYKDVLSNLGQQEILLHIAAQNGNATLLADLLKNNVTCKKDAKNETPLIKAAKNGHLQCVELLVKNCTEAEIKDVLELQVDLDHQMIDLLLTVPSSTNQSILQKALLDFDKDIISKCPTALVNRFTNAQDQTMLDSLLKNYSLQENNIDTSTKIKECIKTVLQKIDLDSSHDGGAKIFKKIISSSIASDMLETLYARILQDANYYKYISELIKKDYNIIKLTNDSCDPSSPALLQRVENKSAIGNAIYQNKWELAKTLLEQLNDSPDFNMNAIVYTSQMFQRTKNTDAFIPGQVKEKTILQLALEKFQENNKACEKFFVDIFKRQPTVSDADIKTALENTTLAKYFVKNWYDNSDNKQTVERRLSDIKTATSEETVEVRFNWDLTLNLVNPASFPLNAVLEFLYDNNNHFEFLNPKQRDVLKCNLISNVYDISSTPEKAYKSLGLLVKKFNIQDYSDAIHYMIQDLILNKQDSDLKNLLTTQIDDGKSILHHWVSQDSYKSVVKALWRIPSVIVSDIVNTQDAKGNTIMHLIPRDTILVYSKDLIQQLIECQAWPEIKNKQGDRAGNFSDTKVKRYLVNALRHKGYVPKAFNEDDKKDFIRLEWYKEPLPQQKQQVPPALKQGGIDKVKFPSISKSAFASAHIAVQQKALQQRGHKIQHESAQVITKTQSATKSAIKPLAVSLTAIQSSMKSAVQSAKALVKNIAPNKFSGQSTKQYSKSAAVASAEQSTTKNSGIKSAINKGSFAIMQSAVPAKAKATLKITGTKSTTKASIKAVAPSVKSVAKVPTTKVSGKFIKQPSKSAASSAIIKNQLTKFKPLVQQKAIKTFKTMDNKSTIKADVKPLATQSILKSEAKFNKFALSASNDVVKMQPLAAKYTMFSLKTRDTKADPSAKMVVKPNTTKVTKSAAVASAAQPTTKQSGIKSASKNQLAKIKLAAQPKDSTSLNKNATKASGIPQTLKSVTKITVKKSEMLKGKTVKNEKYKFKPTSEVKVNKVKFASKVTPPIKDLYNKGGHKHDEFSNHDDYQSEAIGTTKVNLDTHID